MESKKVLTLTMRQKRPKRIDGLWTESVQFERS